MEHRVVVTGMGAVTPIGNSVDEFFDHVKAGKCGIDFITAFDTTDFSVKIAAEVKDFDPKNYMDAKEARRMGRFSQFAIAAAREAIDDSGIDPERIDKVSGSLWDRASAVLRISKRKR